MNYWTRIAVLSFLLFGSAYAADVPAFKQQTIQMPAKFGFGWTWRIWKDIDGNDFTDLLVVSPAGKAIIYFQDSSGFPKVPSQSITFPEGTAWFTVADVSKEPNLEILVSTAEGLACFYQSEGGFEPTARMLIKAKQVFADHDICHIRYVNEGNIYLSGGTEIGLPVVFPERAVIYTADKKHRYRPGKKVDLKHKSSVWKKEWVLWSVGEEKGNEILIQTLAVDKSKVSKKEDTEKKSEYIEKLNEKKKKGRHWYEYGIEEKDINADGKKDLILWYAVGDIDPRTTIIVLIRQEDGKLPEKPNQILRCRGMPINVNYYNQTVSLLYDINNDGVLEIVLVALKTKPISASSLVDAVLSKSLDCVLSTRLFKKGRGYSNQADFSIDVATVLPLSFSWVADLIGFEGDFNADGRTDLIVRRAPNQSDVYLSSTTSGFYERKPALAFKVPPEGRRFVKDLNSDGVSDIYLVDYRKGQITVFLSESSKKRGASR